MIGGNIKVKMQGKTIEVSKLWFQAIASEMALNYNTGLVNRGGSPFAQFRKVFKDCPRSKAKAIEWVYDLAKKQDIPLGAYFNRVFVKVMTKQHIDSFPRITNT